MLQVTFNPKKLHIVPKTLRKCEYNGDTLMLNGCVSSSSTSEMFIGQIVGDRLHFTAVKSMTLSAYPEKTLQREEAPLFPLAAPVVFDDSEDEPEVKETMIQQTVRRNVVEFQKPKASWQPLAIVDKDIRSEFTVQEKDESGEKMKTLYVTPFETDEEMKTDNMGKDCLKNHVRSLLETLSYCKISTFSLLGRDYPEAELLTQLPQIAVLVRGAWIIKSSVLYQGQMECLRDVLLYLFHKQDVVKRSEVTRYMAVDGTMLFNLFAELASQVEGGWVLKCAFDEGFVRRYPDLANKYHARTERLGKNAISFLMPESTKKEAEKDSEQNDSMKESKKISMEPIQPATKTAAKAKSTQFKPKLNHARRKTAAKE